MALRLAHQICRQVNKPSFADINSNGLCSLSTESRQTKSIRLQRVRSADVLTSKTDSSNETRVKSRAASVEASAHRARQYIDVGRRYHHSEGMSVDSPIINFRVDKDAQCKAHQYHLQGSKPSTKKNFHNVFRYYQEQYRMRDSKIMPDLQPSNLKPYCAGKPF